MDLEAGRKRSGNEDIFISYHARDDVQSTYAGAVFHNNRNYQLSSDKNNVSVSHIPFHFIHMSLVPFALLLNLEFALSQSNWDS